MTKLKPPKNKTGKKNITITDAFLEDSRDLDPKDKKIKISFKEKLKMRLASFVGIEMAIKKQYIFRVKFKGQKLKRGDVILSREGVFYAVVQVQQTRARIINIHYLKDRPMPRGVFTLLENSQAKNL